MRKKFLYPLVLILGIAFSASFAPVEPAYAQGTPECQMRSRFLTFPVWYRGLPGDTNCMPQISSGNDLWKIVFNVAEILIQAAAYVSGFFVLYGGIQYILSTGEPSKMSAAKTTITRALVGLVIAIFSVAIVALIGGVV